MSRFYVFSLCLHILVGYLILRTPEKAVTLKNRQMMNVSYNQMSNNSGAESIEQKERSEDPPEEEPPVEETQEVEEVQEIVEPQVETPIEPIKEPEPSVEPVVVKVPKPVEKKEMAKPAPKPAKKITKPPVKKSVKPSNSTSENTGSSTGSNIMIGVDGIYTASSSEGIEYEFLKVVNPKFPILAKRMGYKDSVIIKTKFLVDTDGKVKNIEILDGINKFGFREEAMKALSQWKFKPIYYEGKNIRVYFYKDFKFNVAS